MPVVGVGGAGPLPGPPCLQKVLRRVCMPSGVSCTHTQHTRAMCTSVCTSGGLRPGSLERCSFWNPPGWRGHHPFHLCVQQTLTRHLLCPQAAPACAGPHCSLSWARMDGDRQPMFAQCDHLPTMSHGLQLRLPAHRLPLPEPDVMAVRSLSALCLH